MRLHYTIPANLKACQIVFKLRDITKITLSDSLFFLGGGGGGGGVGRAGTDSHRHLYTHWLNNVTNRAYLQLHIKTI